jgi:transposase-like protein
MTTSTPGSPPHTSRHKSLESPLRGNSHGGFGGRPHGKEPAPQAPRRAAHPSGKVPGQWVDLYWAIDQYGQVIDVLVSARRDADAARRFFQRALRMLKVTPSEVVTDAAAAYPAVLDELVPSAWHHVEQHANNPIEADHSRLKHRLRPMRGLQTDRTAQVITAGHAFHAEPATRTLRTWTRRTARPASRRGIQSTRPNALTSSRPRV